jgi:hypothetical protein
MAKPIRIFYSRLSGRFYATSAWKEVKPGIVEVTGNKTDVTDDIANLIIENSIKFETKDEQSPKDTANKEFGS